MTQHFRLQHELTYVTTVYQAAVESYSLMIYILLLLVMTHARLQDRSCEPIKQHRMLNLATHICLGDDNFHRHHP